MSIRASCAFAFLELSAVSLLSLMAMAPVGVEAQDLPLSVAQMAERRFFNIAAQPLGPALGIFGQQAGRQITVDGAAVRGLDTPGVQGTMSIDEGLRQLLGGTGLIYSFPSATTIAVQRPGQSGASGALLLDPVQVQGVFAVPQQAMIDNIPPPYAGGQVATGGQLGLLGNRDVMDTPFNQTSYTAKKVQDQQAQTIRDVLIDNPSVRTYQPDGSWGDNNVRIRGFQVVNAATSYGGLFGMLPTATIMSELAERVEVLNGPSALLNGMNPANAIGGTINVVPKRAPATELTQITAGYASAGQLGGHVDFGRRLGPEQEFGIRFNGVFRAGQTAVDWNTDQKGLAVLGLDYRGERIRVSADLGYQSGYIGGVLPMLGPTNNVQLPWAPDAQKNFGQPWNEITRKDLFGVVRGELDLRENLTAYASIGAHDYRDNELLGGDNVAVSNFNGTGTSTPYTLSYYSTYLTGEAGLRGRVDTGPIGHELAVAATAYQQEAGSGFVFGTPYTTNIYSPNLIARPNIPTAAANKASTTTLSSLAFADTLTGAEKRIQLTIGARLQRVITANYNAVTGAPTTSYDQSALSPSVSLVFKPWENVSIYANWIQGLQPGVIVGQNFRNAGEVFAPYKTNQYEAGIKVDWGKLTTTASIFQIAQPSVLTNIATNTRYLGGEQRNRGLELNFFGEVTEGVRIIGGAMFLDAVLAKTQGGLTDGWVAPFSPGTQLNLAGEWDLPFLPGLTATGRIVYTGTQYFDTTFPRRSLPEWTRLDIGARYVFDNPGAKGKPLAIRFNVENLLDSSYWAGGTSATYLTLGAPRVFRLAMTADF